MRARRRVWVTAAVGIAASAAAALAAQQPTFRANVELIVADVQVVGKDGQPVQGLTPDKFRVTVSGKTQKVLSADYVRYTSGAAAEAFPPVTTSERPAPRVIPSLLREDEGRFIMLAIDSLSFPPELSVGVVNAAKAFVAKLDPDDMVGLWAYPGGVKVDPTDDHTVVVQGLAKVTGGRFSVSSGRFHVRPSEAIDAAPEFARRDQWSPGTRVLAIRECGTDDPIAGMNCFANLGLELNSIVAIAETVAHQSVGGLRTLLQALAGVPGRKTIVVVTAGMPTADRPGARPNIEELSAEAGREAALANATVYAVYVDANFIERNSAESARGQFNEFTSRARDSDVMSRWFDQFSGAAGGMVIFTDLFGRGEIGFNRILTEISGYYRLGIDVGTVERNGRAQPIRVRVDVPGAAVRGRSWVVVPRGKT